MNFGETILQNLDERHPLYKDVEDQWQTMHDVLGGERMIKKLGEKYLPKLSDQSTREYDRYKGHAYFYEATGRTLQGLVGMLFSKEPSLVKEGHVTDKDKMFYDSLTYDNSRFRLFLRYLAKEFLSMGRLGLLVDGPRSVKKGAFRPYLIPYTAQQIINWDYDMPVEGKHTQLRYVVLEEMLYEAKDNTNLQKDEVKQWRCLWLDRNNVYHQAIYRKHVRETTKEERAKSQGFENKMPNDKNKKEEFILQGQVITPLHAQRPFHELPFYIMDISSNIAEVGRPQLMGLADMNFSHYVTSAQLENARFFLGVPTPVLTGFDDLNDVKLGTSQALVSNNPSANASYLEYSGSGLQTLEKALVEKEEKMVLLGSRILEPDRGTSRDSTQTHMMRRRGESSILSAFSTLLSINVTEAVRMALKWQGKSDLERFRVELVKDFTAFLPSPHTLDLLMRLHKEGLLSYEAVFTALKKMELLPDEISIQKEVSNIKSGALPAPAPEPPPAPAPAAKKGGGNSK